MYLPLQVQPKSRNWLTAFRTDLHYLLGLAVCRNLADISPDLAVRFPSGDSPLEQRPYK